MLQSSPEWAIRLLTDEAFRAAGLTRRVVYEVNEWAMVLGLVAAGMGPPSYPAASTSPCTRIRRARCGSCR
jgi:DNA-binding transcriptional LysR family regulator